MKNFLLGKVAKCQKRPQLSKAAQTYVLLPLSRGVDKETSWDLNLGSCPLLHSSSQNQYPWMSSSSDTSSHQQIQYLYGTAVQHLLSSA